MTACYASCSVSRMVKETPLRAARVDALMTQEQLAEKAGVHATTIVRAEQGTLPGPLTQERIARALGLSRHDLFPATERAS